MVSQLVGTLGFPDCEDRHVLEGVLRSETDRKKEMKNGWVDTHRPKQEGWVLYY